MLSLEAETNPKDLAEQPELPVERRLSLVPRGLGEVALVEKESTGSGLDRLEEELNGSVQAQENLALLRRLGAEIDTGSDSPSAQIILGKGRGPEAYALLYGLVRTGMQDFPGRADIVRPDTLEAMRLFLLAQETHRKEPLKFSDGKLAIGYDYPGSAVFIENLDGSERNGLKGAPERLLKAVLTSDDLEAEAAKIKQPLRELQSLKYQAISRPWNS